MPPLSPVRQSSWTAVSIGSARAPDGEHHRLLVFQRSPRTIDQGCSGAGYLVEHLPGPPTCLGPLGSHRPRAAMLEAEITQTRMFVRTAPKRPVVLAIRSQNGKV